MALSSHVKRDSIPSPKANPVGGLLAVYNVGTLVLDAEDGRRHRIDDARRGRHIVKRDLLGACTSGHEEDAHNTDEVSLTPRHDRLPCCPTSCVVLRHGVEVDGRFFASSAVERPAPTAARRVNV